MIPRRSFLKAAASLALAPLLAKLGRKPTPTVNLPQIGDTHPSCCCEQAIPSSYTVTFSGINQCGGEYSITMKDCKVITSPRTRAILGRAVYGVSNESL